MSMFSRFLKNQFCKKNLEHKIEIKIINVGSETLEEYYKICSILKEKISIVQEFGKSGSCKYIYAPKKQAIDANQFLEAALTLISRRLDFVIVSNTLDEFPLVGAECLEDAFIYSIEKFQNVAMILGGNRNFCGKILRLPGYRKDNTTIGLKFMTNQVRLEEDSYLLCGDLNIPSFNNVNVKCEYQKKSKLIFVFPIFMAVGGVERNTIEIMAKLQKDYEFCVITMERHTKEQGSLNHQLKGICVANYDLKELVEFGDYFDILETLKEIYKPDIVWLCNNSPWMEMNLLKVRRIFENQKIIAQDVYDTKYGWIEYYDSEGIQSLDKYIAVNQKIKNVFINKYNISNTNIRVIYSAIDDSRIRVVGGKSWDIGQLCEKYGLSKGKRHIALIGRMTSQKNPIRYLNIISSVYKKYNEIEFLLVGDGNLSKEIEKFISENKLQDCVKRIKFVESTPELFQILDGLVLTSMYEGLAIVSIEAMCLGVPILSTDTGDLKLFLDRTKGGRIIDENMSDKENFIAWYEQLEDLKENARTHGREILDFFSAENIAKQYRELFDEK